MNSTNSHARSFSGCEDGNVEIRSTVILPLQSLTPSCAPLESSGFKSISGSRVPAARGPAVRAENPTDIEENVGELGHAITPRARGPRSFDPDGRRSLISPERTERSRPSRLPPTSRGVSVRSVVPGVKLLDGQVVDPDELDTLIHEVLRTVGGEVGVIRRELFLR